MFVIVYVSINNVFISDILGQAVVTLDKAALWTDGRYFLQAEMELDCNWILQKEGRGIIVFHHYIPEKSPTNTIRKIHAL